MNRSSAQRDRIQMMQVTAGLRPELQASAQIRVRRPDSGSAAGFAWCFPWTRPEARGTTSATPRGGMGESDG